MKMKQKLYEKGLERYPLTWVIGQNLFLIIYFVIAFIGMYPLQIANIPVISIAYIAFIGIMLIFVLRKHLCTHCFYYGKICNTGWGKLASYLFKQNSGNYALGGKLASLTWMLATLAHYRNDYCFNIKLVFHKHYAIADYIHYFEWSKLFNP